MDFACAPGSVPHARLWAYTPKEAFRACLPQAGSVASKVPDLEIPGITSGSGDMKAVAKGVETKIAKGIASKMSLKTAVKGAIGGQVAAAGRTATEATGDAVKHKICHTCN